MTPMTQATHYRPSHRVSILLFPIALAICAAIGSVGAVVYAYCMVYVPVAQLAFLLPLLYGAAMGAAVGFVFKQCKVRSPLLTAFAAFVITAVSYGLSWIPWAYATLARAEAEVTLLDVLFPPTFIQILGGIYEYGAWSIGSNGEPVSGVMLGVCWVMEAIFVLAIAPAVALGIGSSGVFCEKCEKWCTASRDVMRLPADVQGTVASRLDGQDVRVLGEVGRAQPYDNPFLRVDLDSCLGCGETHTLTVLHVMRTMQKNREQLHETKVVDHVFVTREQAEWLRRGM
jgi:hypothetical protein